MNTRQFAQDLSSSVDRFLAKLHADPGLKADADKRLAALLSPQELKSIKSKKHRQKVEQEMTNSLATQGGLISEAGNIINAHPKEKNP